MRSFQAVATVLIGVVCIMALSACTQKPKPVAVDPDDVCLGGDWTPLPVKALRPMTKDEFARRLANVAVGDVCHGGIETYFQGGGYMRHDRKSDIMEGEFTVQRNRVCGRGDVAAVRCHSFYWRVPGRVYMTVDDSGMAIPAHDRAVVTDLPE